MSLALRRLLVAALAVCALFTPAQPRAEQASIVQPVTGPRSMSDLEANFLNPALRSILSLSSGSSAPANGPGNAPLTYQLWLDTSGAVPWLRIYDSAQWIGIGTVNPSTHVFTPSIPAGALPAPTTSLLGGVKASSAPANQFATGVDTTGASTYRQPVFADIGNTIACAQLVALTGDVVTVGCAATIQPASVTYAKLQAVAAASLVGNPTGSSATAQPITLGATLAFNGTVLQTAAHSGDCTTAVNSFAITCTKTNGVTFGPAATATSASTTVNGQTCALGGTCTISATAGTITVGTTAISGGASNGVLFNNAGALGNTGTANSAVIVTNASGVPGPSTTLPNGLAMGTPVSLSLANATGLPLGGSGVTGTLGVGNGGTGCAAAAGACLDNIIAATGTGIARRAAAGSYTFGGLVTVAEGGTGLSAGTSGGIPYYASSTTMASSGALAANALVVGGGAGGAPSTPVGLGTTSTVLHGNASGAPSYGAVNLTSDVSNVLPLANGGTGNTTAAGARGATGLNIDNLCTFGDANYTAAPTCRQIQTTAAFTAPRTLTLPAASAVNPGQRIAFKDAAGAISGTNTLTLARNSTPGTDLINSAPSQALTAAYAGADLDSDGSSKLTYTASGSGGGSGTVTSIAAGTGLTGGTITTSGTIAVDPTYAPNRVSFSNLKITNGATPNTQVAITVDSLTMKGSGNFGVIALNVSVTCATGSSGANGLDAGTIAASTWYAVYVVSNNTTAACLLSTSATAPTMPSGYNYRARLGWVRTDSSSVLLRTLQYNEEASYTVVSGSNTASLPIASSGIQGATSAPTWVAVSMAAFVPPTAIKVEAVGVNGTNGYTYIAAPNNNYGGYTSTTNPPPIAVSGAGASKIPFSMILESANIYWAIDSSGGLFIRGWKDNL